MKPLPGLVFTACCLGLYFGCVRLQTSLPPLPAAKLSRSKDLPVPGPQAQVTLSWENHPEPDGTNFQTGLEGSTNLVQWYEVARIDYVPFPIVTLTNRPGPREFYRAFNCLRRPSQAAAARSPQAPLSLPEYARKLPGRPDLKPRSQGAATPD